jgi:hypothetical protein
MSDLKVDGIIASTGTNTNLTLQGKGTGKVAIGDGALLFPDADGSANQVIETNASGVLSFVSLPSAGFTQGTEQATGSGSSVTFGSIPSGVDMIVVNFDDVSQTGTTDLGIQLGDAGGIETSGYIGGSTRAGLSSTAFETDVMPVMEGAGASNNLVGSAILTLTDAATYTWTFQSLLHGTSDGIFIMGVGNKSLSAELTQLKILSDGTFDNGAVNIMYQ